MRTIDEDDDDDTAPSSFLCGMGRKQTGRRHDKVFECFHQRAGKKVPMEAWPTSPVLMEEKNARQKNKAHKYYERQLKTCSWYMEERQRPWIEVVEPYDESEYCYREPCGCVLVVYQSETVGEDRKRCATFESGRSSLSVPRADSRASRMSRVSGNSRTSTEDERSFYDNLCQTCKASTLERRARKYGEWRRRWSGKMAEIRAGEEPPAQCTCAAENLSFQEWKNLYEQDELVKYSRARSDMVSTSDYGTHKSKDSETTTLCQNSTSRSNMKSTSLGYNSDQELDSDSSFSPRDVSDSEPSSPEIRDDGDVDEDLFNNELLWMHEIDCALEQMKQRQSKKSKKSRRKNRKTRPCRTHESYTKATVNTIPLRKSLSEEKTSCSEGHTSFSEGLTSFSEGQTSFSEGNTSVSEGNTSLLEEDTSFPENNTSTSEENTLRFRDSRVCPECKRLQFSENNTPSSEVTTFSFEAGILIDTVKKPYKVENDGIPVICVTPTDYSPPKFPTENDETFPVDPFSEFVEVAKSIDKFYESLHAKQFLKHRARSTTAHDSVEDITEKRETFSVELKKRIQSLERLCSFVDDDDETAFSKQLAFLNNDEKAVWRLSQHSIDLTLKRRSRTSTNSSSNPNSTSTSSSNSRSSMRQDDYKDGKHSVTSTENVCSPDSGFSEKTNSFPALNSPEAAPLGAKWAGSMQWDYTDCAYYFGLDDGEPVVEGEKNLLKTNEGSLSTIHETPPSPQDPLDWDW